MKLFKDTTPDQKKMKWMNFWIFAMLTFILVYSLLMIGFVDHKTDQYIKNNPSVILINPSDYTVMTPNGVSNLIHPMFMNTNRTAMNNTAVPLVTNTQTNAALTEPAFKVKTTYERGDFIVVNFFYVEAIVVEKKPGDQYTVMYKDHNHVLQHVTLHRDLLLSPSPGTVSPVSLLVD